MRFLKSSHRNIVQNFFRHASIGSSLLIIACLLLLSSCSNSDNEKPDVSDIHMNVKIQRFDKDFFSIDTNNISQGLDRVSQQHPTFLPVYFEFFSPVNFIVQQQGKSYSEAVLEYLRNIKPLYDSVQKKYASTASIEKELAANLRYVKHYFPSFKTPVVYASVESLNPENKEEIYGAMYFRDTLVISLQMFMGKDFSVYDPTQYFDYLRRRFEPEYIVPNCLRAITLQVYPGNTETNKLIELMVEKGKQWWLQKKFLPDTPDSLITGYTKAQTEWCRKEEGNIWGSILQNSPDLYTLDKERIRNYLGESPRTMDMPEASPGNIGQWIGWQIVKKFEERNPKMTVQEILATPPAKVFQESRYKPK
jgi:hypothetical protein